MFDKHYNSNCDNEKLDMILALISELQRANQYVSERVSRLSLDISRVENMLDNISQNSQSTISKYDIEAVKNMIRETSKEVREIKKGVVRMNQSDTDNSQIKIEDTGMNLRTKNVLRRAGYVYLKDLEGKDKKEILSIRNLGKSCFKEIVEECEAHKIII